MSQPLRLLLLSPMRTDVDRGDARVAADVVEHLRVHGMDVDATCAPDVAAACRALAGQPHELVIVLAEGGDDEHALGTTLQALRPLCGGALVIALVQQLDEDHAAALLSAGADDVIPVHALARLVPRMRRHQHDAAQQRQLDAPFRAMLETLPHFVWTCFPDGRCDYLSRQWVEYTGVPEAQQLGFGWLAQLHPDDARRTEPAWQDAIRRGVVFDVDYRIRRADGAYRWFKTRAVPMRGVDGTVVRWMGSNTDVDEQKKLEEQQRIERARLDFLMTATPTVLYTARPSGDFGATFISDNVEAVLGHPASRFVDHPAFWIEHVHPDDLASVREALAHAAREDRLTLEYRFGHADGSWRWLLDEVLVRRDDDARAIELIGSLLDITARKEAEEKLQTSEGRYALAVRGTSDGLWDWDIRSDVVYYSPRYLELLGYAIDDIFPTHAGFLERVHPDDRARVQERVAAHLQRREPYDVELRLRSRDGRYRWFRDRCQAEWDAAGTPLRVAGAITDIAEQKNAAEALLVAKQQAEAANRAKSEFVANMSHEIRTPLNGITGAAQLLHLTALTTTQREYVDAIATSSEGLLALINDVLELSKIEAMQVELEQTPFHLRTTLEEVLRSQGSLVQSKGLVVDVDVAPDVPETLIGDARRLRQILLNLIGNAIKFTDRGTIRVAATLRERNDDVVVLSLVVQDTGIGIAADMLQKVFEPFVQADASTARRYGGTGLGLAISTRLAELMGGTISVQSEQRAGSSFILHVPFVVGDAASIDVDTARLRDIAGVRWQGAPLRILVVDDLPLNRLIANRLLAWQGHRVLEAGSGQDALDMTARDPFDAVLMDIQMPGMSGVEAVRLIRQREKASGEHLPVIALTARALQEEREQILHEGFDGYITKPMQLQTLVDELRRCVDPSAAHASRAIPPASS